MSSKSLTASAPVSPSKFNVLLNVFKEKSLDNRIVAVDKFAPLITEAFTVDTLHVLILAFGLIKLFAKTEEGVSISPPKNASLVSVCRYNGHCPLT